MQLIKTRFLHLRRAILLPSLFFIFVLIASTSSAQVTCGGTIIDAGCLKNPSQTYQCINGNFNASTLFGVELLIPTLALSTPQFLIVKGKITFDNDYTFASGSEIIFVDNNSGFRVSGSKKLTLSSSWLHGCTKLWAGVEVLNAGEIVAKNSTFEDAKAAIILRNQSVVIVTGNTFKKNVFGIIGLSANPAVNISIFLGSKSGISSNTFWGNNQLLESIIPNTVDSGFGPSSDVAINVTNFPFSGIWIERVNSFTIGYSSPGKVVPSNMFQDFGQNLEFNIDTRGIGSMDSNIEISNSRFSNFGNFDATNTALNITSYAVYARTTNQNILVQTTFIGTNLTFFVTPVTTFSNCWQDILTIGTNLSVTEMTSKKAGNSITGFDGVTATLDYEINNNNIFYYHAIGIEIGVFKPTIINIDNNNIIDNDDLYDPLQHLGIVIKNPLTVTTEVALPGCKISNNLIQSSSIFMSGHFTGIGLRKVTDVTIENNEIFELDPITNIDRYYGIRVQQSPADRLKLYSNTIKGSKINYTVGHGIYIPESTDCVLNCNETDLINAGITMTGLCNNADVSKNRFYYHDIGFSLGDPLFAISVNEISLQKAKENRWFGTNSTIEAFAKNTTSALASIFQINSSVLTSDYWPLPRKISTSDDIFTWFVLLNGEEPSEDFTCLASEKPEKEKLSDTEEHLLNNTYSPPGDYAALDWEARWKFSKRLEQSIGLRTIDDNTEEYYAANYNETYSRLSAIYLNFLNRWKPDNDLTFITGNSSANIRTAIEQRFALNDLLPETEENNTGLYEDMAAVENMMEENSIDYKNNFETLSTLVDQNIHSLISEIEQIECTEGFEDDMKTVVSTLLSSHFTNGVITNEQTEIIQNIANTCRYTSGYAVVLARSFFPPKDVYEQDIECDTEERNGSKMQASSYKIDLYPNPVNQSISLYINQPFENASVRLYNSQSILLNTFVIKAQNTFIPASTLNNGTYYLEIHVDGKPTIYKSFVKVQ